MDITPAFITEELSAVTLQGICTPTIPFHNQEIRQGVGKQLYRVYTDMVADLTHFGHWGLLRRIRSHWKVRIQASQFISL